MDDHLNPTALLLVQKNLLSLEKALLYQQEVQTHAYRLLPYLIAQAQLCPKLVGQLLAQRFDFPWIDLNEFDLAQVPKLFSLRFYYVNIMFYPFSIEINNFG